MAIQSFASRAIERFFKTGRVPKGAGWTAASRVAARKLDMLDYAHELLDLASPPGNRLKGDLRGLHSIRVNDQWRVVFEWTTAGPSNIDIRDYH